MPSEGHSVGVAGAANDTGAAAGAAAGAPPGSTDSYHKWKLGHRLAHQDFDNQNWYRALEDITFPTEFAPLPAAAAHAMIAAYKHRHNGGPEPTAAQAAAVEATRAVLDAMIHRVGVGDHGAGAFVRLSSRSPKDAAGIDKAVFETELTRQRAMMSAAREEAGGGGGGAEPEAAAASGGAVDVYETNARMCAYVHVSAHTRMCCACVRNACYICRPCAGECCAPHAGTAAAPNARAGLTPPVLMCPFCVVPCAVPHRVPAPTGSQLLACQGCV